MLVVAVEDLDVDARCRHLAGELTQLAGFPLTQALDHHVALAEDAQTSRHEGRAGDDGVLDEKVTDPSAIDDKGTAPFDADPGLTQRLTHGCKGSRVILELDGQILHEPAPLLSLGAASTSSMVGSQRIGTQHELAMTQC